jgi:Tfp pilus assembly protein PilW
MVIKNRGFTLVETLFYIAGLILLLLVISTILLYMFNWYKKVTIEPRVDQVGTLLVDRIVRDIHTSGTINSSQSSFNTTNGSLSVTGDIDSVSTVSYTHLTLPTM